MAVTKRMRVMAGTARLPLPLLRQMLRVHGWISGSGVAGALAISMLLCRAAFMDLSTQTSYACGYRTYPEPQHHQGLPFVQEVFAADEGRSVYFVAVNKGGCLLEWKGAQEFHGKANETHHFVCGFPDGTLVASDPVHTKQKDSDMDWSNSIIVIRCDIPPLYQKLVQQPSPTTTLTVNLHATEDLESTPWRLLPIHESTSFQNLPVCHGEWPTATALAATGSSAVRKKLPVRAQKEYLSMMTKIKLSYCHHEGPCTDDKRLSIDPTLVVSWIAHHASIGFEHFYIYDNADEPHGILETILEPFVQSGLVTYVWYPQSDCIVDYETAEKHVGDRLTTGQGVASTGALRRYAHRSTYMAHLDMDEYIIPPANVTDIKSMIRDNESYDYFTLPHTWFAPCDSNDGGDQNRTTGNASILPWDTSLCHLPDTTPPKSIMKTSRILTFFVHYPTATMEGKYAFENYRKLDDFMIAHYRGRRPVRDPKTIRFVKRLDVMARYREKLHQTIDAHMKHFDKK